ncbi:carboxypeptidase B-like [Choristoneura fumiferana]|uniref:carboxypeptidase B-like n=1 Tax=Choristoneura fumiferana TaxID=7141 RepID=UPI003D15BAEF
MDVMVEGMRKCQVEKLLRERDIPFEVSTDKTAPVPYYPSPPPSPTRRRPNSPPLQRPSSPYSRLSYDAKNLQKRVLDWKNYYPLHLIYNFMMDLETQFPSTCTVSSIGKSVEGRDIKMLKISNSDANNTGAWLDGAIHAREWISTSVVTYIANYIANNFNNLPKSMTNKDWFFVPVLNPDGYEYSHATDRMWRKNRYRMGHTVVGVDLNRNFGNSWGKSLEFSSNDPTHANFRGEEPFSEPEAAAVKDLILYSGTPFKIFLTFHAYSEVIAFPWCFTPEPCPDYVTLLEGATAMAKAMYATSGRMYKVGNFKDLMYSACGTSIDWSYGTARIPFSYLVELRSKEYRFLLPKEEITDCCKETLSGVMALADFVDKQKCTTCNVDVRKLR